MRRACPAGVPAQVNGDSARKSIYSEKLRTFVRPPAVSIALSGVMATPRNSRTRSPTNTVLPLINAEGFLLKKTPCNFNGAGFGASDSVVELELVLGVFADR